MLDGSSEVLLLPQGLLISSTQQMEGVNTQPWEDPPTMFPTSHLVFSVLYFHCPSADGDKAGPD